MQGNETDSDCETILASIHFSLDTFFSLTYCYTFFIHVLVGLYYYQYSNIMPEVGLVSDSVVQFTNAIIDTVSMRPKTK